MAVVHIGKRRNAGMTRVPVVLINGAECFRHRVDTDALNTALEASKC